MAAVVQGFMLTFHVAGLAMLVAGHLGLSAPRLHDQDAATPPPPAAPVEEGQTKARV